MRNIKKIAKFIYMCVYTVGVMCILVGIMDWSLGVDLGVEPCGKILEWNKNSIQAMQVILFKIQRKFPIWVLISYHNHPMFKQIHLSKLKIYQNIHG